MVCHDMNHNLLLFLIFSKSLAVLSGSEENSGLSAAIAQMSSVQEKVAYIHNDQASAEFFQLSELIKDYVGLIGAVKDIMQVNNSRHVVVMLHKTAQKERFPFSHFAATVH